MGEARSCLPMLCDGVYGALEQAQLGLRLGNSGLKVSRIILGTMQYGTPEWQAWVLGEEEAVKHIKYAYHAGIQTFDTADTYSNGLSEVILGKAIKQLRLPREEIVILTKVYFTVARENGIAFQDSDDARYVNQHGLSRKHIFDSVKASLARLGVDYIDVLQCHRFDYETPIEETMQALHDVVKAGYNHYNALYREEEREMFPTLKLFGVGAIPWSPLARGYLTRPLKEQTTRGETDDYSHQYLKAYGTPEIIKRSAPQTHPGLDAHAYLYSVEDLAVRKGLSMAQVAVMWSLSKEGVTAPIVGTTSMKNLEELIAVADMKLTEEELKYLEEPYVAQALFGHW
ncbi:hypothetical protein C0992_000563 [Termitomyces sp. T32_za158]|nr:hypothetical protein C0992_000563 [Termitomyces sp. T32_za158]